MSSPPSCKQRRSVQTSAGLLQHVLVEVRPRLQTAYCFLRLGVDTGEPTFRLVSVETRGCGLDVSLEHRGRLYTEPVPAGRPLAALSGAVHCAGRFVTVRARLEPDRRRGSAAAEVVAADAPAAPPPAPLWRPDARREHEAACRRCGRVVVRRRFARALPLPSENWREMLGNVFCHGDGADADMHARVRARPGDCFYAASHVVLSPDDVTCATVDDVTSSPSDDALEGLRGVKVSDSAEIAADTARAAGRPANGLVEETEATGHVMNGAAGETATTNRAASGSAGETEATNRAASGSAGETEATNRAASGSAGETEATNRAASGSAGETEATNRGASGSAGETEATSSATGGSAGKKGSLAGRLTCSECDWALGELVEFGARLWHHRVSWSADGRPELSLDASDVLRRVLAHRARTCDAPVVRLLATAPRHPPHLLWLVEPQLDVHVVSPGDTDGAARSAIKVLWRSCDEEAARRHRADLQVSTLELDDALIVTLLAELRDSQRWYPESERQLGDDQVGLLLS